MPKRLYTDGSVVPDNPSEIGGSWCWIEVGIDGHIVSINHGFVTPEEMGLANITNNLTELLAAVKALEAHPKGWKGVLYTDSRVTLLRLTSSNKWEGVPPSLKERVLALRENRRYKVALVGGHPTKAELRAGYRKKGKSVVPVSHWNVLCDRRCDEVNQAYLEKYYYDQETQKDERCVG